PRHATTGRLARRPGVPGGRPRRSRAVHRLRLSYRIAATSARDPPENSEASTRCRRGPRKPPEGPGKPGRQPARPRGKTRGMAVTSFSLTPGKRVLFLTRDPD